MVTSNISKCPDCGGRLKHYDSVPRIVRTKYGKKQHIKIRRLRCCECKCMHRELPDFIFPYKHYDGEIIRGVIEGFITAETIGFEDYPSEITMTRWLRE